MTKSQFIAGAPMRPPSHFTGPVAWWSDSLTCGGIERQVVASARFFQQQGKNITLLCRSISHSGGNDFFLQEAQACQCALQRDPPCARKSDPPLGVMCKDTKWGFNEGGKRGSATLRLSSPPRASTIRARPFVKDGCVSGGFRFLFQ